MMEGLRNPGGVSAANHCLYKEHNLSHFHPDQPQMSQGRLSDKGSAKTHAYGIHKLMYTQTNAHQQLVNF